MKKLNLLLLVLLIIISGCAGTSTQTDKSDQAKLLMSRDANFYVYDYMGRHYVLASEESSSSFVSTHVVPYTKTILGAGPHGETVIFEVAKKDPESVERLMATYESIPFLVETTGDDYTVYKSHGRLYVIGDAEMKQSFAANGHMPYAKTILGAGPAGETVVYQIDPKNPELENRLMKKFQE
ncbi:MAG: hypothetical protein JXQ81_10440 [Desulfuromonadales bacterium]|nr:hypothetical protein [Desulfuromonadales bacterium]